MKFCILKENKKEFRVSLVPNDVKLLVNNKHDVFVVSKAGVNAGFSDQEYVSAGAKIIKNNKLAIKEADVILKISKISSCELKQTNGDQLLISLFNLANNPSVLAKLLKSNIIALGIEAINENGFYKILVPQEQIKGRFGALVGAYNLSKLNKNAVGKTFCPIENNSERAQFVVLNASYAGLEAAKTILALGANLTILENDENLVSQIANHEVLKSLANLHKSKFVIQKADFTDLSKEIMGADVLINTNSVPGSITSKRITQKMISTMKQGGVFVDLASDQGFGSDTETKSSSIKKPTYVVEGVSHFVFENLPSLFAHSISVSVSGLLTKYLLDIKHNKPIEALKNNETLLNAVVVYKHTLTNQIAANSLHLESKSIKELI